MIKIIDIKSPTKNKGSSSNLAKKKSEAKTASILSLIAPSHLLLEGRGAERLEEGTWRPWNNNFDVRLDRRPDHMGGDQIHIRNRNGSAWAYRHTGGRSEVRKYTLPANKEVRDIVQHYFNVNLKESAQILIESMEGDALKATL
jgi:hypothetical protein